MFHGEITSKISNDYTLNKFYHMYTYTYYSFIFIQT